MKLIISENPEALKKRLRAMQEVSSQKVGEVSVSYSETSIASDVSTDLADLKETTFGLQLLSLLQLYGFAKYIP